jgi:hypothetical protein
MRHAAVAIVLCIVCGVAGAQRVVPTQAAAATARQGGELIKSAVAAPRDGATAATPAPTTAKSAPVADDAPDSGHDGKAMMLAALALMSGIALRRSGPRGQ